MQGPDVEWGSLDDVVMGGVSESSFARMQSGREAVFSGRVSAANNGGFASVRASDLELYDCSHRCGCTNLNY